MKQTNLTPKNPNQRPPARKLVVVLSPSISDLGDYIASVYSGMAAF